MATPSLYDVLSQTVGVTPTESESEQEFLKRLKISLDALGEDEFTALPEDAKLWSNDAFNAVQNNQPIQMLPGAPFANGKDEDPLKPKAAAGGKSADKGKQAAAKPAGGKKAATGAKAGKAGKATEKAPKAAAAPKPKKEAAPKQPRGDGKPGVLELLMIAAHADPKASPADLKARVEAANPGMEVKVANAIGIRQQYRRFASFFNRQKVFKEPISLD